MRNEIEVMRVVRVPPMGKLVVQVGDRRLESLTEIRDESLRRRLMAAIGELIVFAGGYAQLVETGVAPPPSAEAAGSIEPTRRTEEETLTAEQEAFLNSLEEELKATIHAAPPKTTEVDKAQVQLDTPATPPSSLNLVTEIDDILQKHLADDPSLDGRSIHLEQPPSGTLQIRVDNTYYQHPKEIEDANVRQAIKKALQEWESR